MKKLSEFKELSREELKSIHGGIGGGYVCKNGSSGSSPTATYDEIRDVAKTNCGSQGIAYTYYFEDEIAEETLDILITD